MNAKAFLLRSLVLNVALGVVLLRPTPAEPPAPAAIPPCAPRATPAKFPIPSNIVMGARTHPKQASTSTPSTASTP